MTMFTSSESAAERRRKGPRFGSNFMAVLEVSRDMVCLCADGRVIDANSAALRLLGAAEREQLSGLRVNDLVDADYAPAVDHLLGLTEIEDQAFPIRLHRLDGKTVDVELQIHPARELGEGHAVLTGRDISRQGHLARTAIESEDRFRVLVEESMHLIAQCHGGRLLYINKAGARMLGMARSGRLDGVAVADIFHGDYRAIIDSDPALLLGEDGTMPMQLARCDGSFFDAQILATPLPSPGVVPDYMIEARDITAHNRAVAALRHMNDTLESQVVARTRELADERAGAVEARILVENLLDTVPNPLWWKDAEGRYLGYNHAFRAMHAVGRDTWIGRTMTEILDRTFVEVAAKADAQALASHQQVQFEAQLVFADSQLHDVVVSKVAWRSALGEPKGVISVLLDITERKRMEAELRRLATTDVLTGAFNRRHFMTVAQTETERAERHHHPLSVLMLDIDHFKRINDTHGHPAGDEAIRALAATVTATVRTIDILGRLGGEEFAVVLPETGLDEALVVAERLRQAVAAIRIPAGDGDIAFTTSIGVAERLDDSTVETILSRADMALYSAKRSGRNKVAAG